MDDSLYDEFGNYIGPELSGSEVCLLSHINVYDKGVGMSKNLKS